MDVSESDRALVVAEQKLAAIRRLAEHLKALAQAAHLDETEAFTAEGAAFHQGMKAGLRESFRPLLAVLDSDDTPKRACILCWVKGVQREPVGFIDPGWYCAAHAEQVRSNDTTEAK